METKPEKITATEANTNMLGKVRALKLVIIELFVPQWRVIRLMDPVLLAVVLLNENCGLPSWQ